MKKFLPLIAALAFVGCADETPETDTVIVEDAEVVTPAEDDMMMEADTTMIEADSTMMEGEMMADSTAM